MLAKNSAVFDTDSKTKISIMLSDSAFYVLRADYYNFEGIKTDNRKNEHDNKRLPGTFLAKVCEKHIDGFRQKLKERKTAENNAEDDESCKSPHRKQSDRFPTFQIAMSEDFASFLKSCSIPEVMMYFSPPAASGRNGKVYPPGYFVSEVLEDYAGQNYCEREKIFFSDIVDIINTAAANKKEIRYLYLTKEKIMEYSMFPVAVIRDEWFRHNYVLGTTRSGRIISARLSRFYDKPRQLSAKETDEIKEYKKEARKAVGENEIMFAGEKTIDVKIRMRQTGHEMFNDTSFLRPRHISRIRLDTDDSYCWEYRFRCTKSQIRFYFYKFGDRIIIDEPYDLHKEFERNYLKSFLIYWTTEENASSLCADTDIDGNELLEKLRLICDALHKPDKIDS